MSLAEIDQLEVCGHTFERINLEKRYDFWVCQFVIDGVKREEVIVPHQNVVELGLRPYSPEFEIFMQAQSLGAGRCCY